MHKSNTELSSCHLLLLCGNTEDSACEKAVTVGNVSDGSQALIILMTELNLKKKLLLHSCWYMDQTNLKSFIKTLLEKDMNCPSYESCNRYRVLKMTQVRITSGKKKELKERSSIFLSISTVFPYSLKL